MEIKTYNGWSNYETWVTALWLDNDESSYRLMRSLTRQVWREAPQSTPVREWGWTCRQAAMCELAKSIRQFIEEANPVEGNTVYADLMNAALKEVDWGEIAQHYTTDCSLNEQEQEKKKENGNEQHVEEKQSK